MNMISVESLTVKDSNKNKILDDVSLKIKKGETLLICGKPGSGKTILLKAIKKLLDYEDGLKVSGKIECEGDVGIVFQHPEKQIVRSKVVRDIAFELENLGLPLDEINKRIKKYTSELKAKNLLSKNTYQLSHGEKTKVALISCVVAEPDVILLDEPFTPLDYENQLLLLESIDRLKSLGKTIVIAEHDVRELLAIADRVIILKNGKIQSVDKPKNLIYDLLNEGIRIPFKTELAARRNKKIIPLNDDQYGGELL